MPVLDLSQSAQPYTVGYLINRTFDLLLASAREDMNRLTSEVLVGDASITCDFPSGRLKAGTYVAIDDEVMYVWSSQDNSAGGCTAQVQRAMKGTQAEQHAIGSIAYVNPYFTRYQVRQTLQDEIRSWGPQVFAPKSKIISGTDFVRGYDLGQLGSLYRVIDVQRAPDTLWATPSTGNNWNSWTGNISRVAIYNSVLSSGQVTTHYNAGFVA